MQELATSEKAHARLRLENEALAARAATAQEAARAALACKDAEIARLADRLAAQEDVHLGEMGEMAVAKQHALGHLRLENEALTARAATARVEAEKAKVRAEEEKLEVEEDLAAARAALSVKDTELAAKEEVIGDRDAALAGRDEDIERLRLENEALAEGGGAARAALAVR